MLRWKLICIDLCAVVEKNVSRQHRCFHTMERKPLITVSHRAFTNALAMVIVFTCSWGALMQYHWLDFEDPNRPQKSRQRLPQSGPISVADRS